MVSICSSINQLYQLHPLNLWELHFEEEKLYLLTDDKFEIKWNIVGVPSSLLGKENTINRESWPKHCDQIVKISTPDIRTAKIPYGENSGGRNFRTEKFPYDKNFVRLNFRTAKIPYGEKSYGKKSYGEKS